MDRIKRNVKINIVLCFICIVLVVPILVFSSKSIPAADDFSNSVIILNLWKTHNSSLSAAIDLAIQYYKTLSGYYSASFFNVFFCAYVRGGTFGVRLFNTCANAGFFISLFVLIRTFSKYILRCNSTVNWIIFTSFIYILINGYSNSEIYTWYCVVVAYIFPISLMFIGLSFFILAVAKNELFCVPASLLLFLSSGSSLNVSALNCGLSLIVAFYGLVVLKKSRSTIIVFVSSFMGCVINLASPGNYIRHETAMGSDYTVLKSLKDSIVICIDAFDDRVTQTPFLVILVLLFVVSQVYIKDDRNIKCINPASLGIIVILGVVIVNYPVCLGYSLGALPDRCIFVQDLTIYILSFLWVFNFSFWIRMKFGEINFSSFEVILFISVLAMIFVCMIGIRGGSKGFTTGYMIDSIVSGNLNECIDYEEGIISEIVESEEDDVVIIRQKKLSNPYVKGTGISESSKYWVNTALSEYFNKSSVRIEYEQD